ncbi:MAG: tetratricopeptide repeat protein [Firmicutes bacterium]|nr:tetratricopeptide repeat protein [Bacillota bacterium]MCM1401193.1 tetratricopeptide repeat protein [Bacteroides sp.]MCM1477110.1 tetratricopeptide repeat protein [Bacteroides sp.]
MANTNEKESQNAIDNLNDSLTGIEEKVANNQKTIMWVCVGITAVIAIILIYMFAIRKPGIENSNNAIGQADLEMLSGNDSTALVQYQHVADEYGYEAGNRAQLNSAIILYRQGKYEEAINYLKKYSGKESVIGASAKALEGDCYVNMDKLDEALACFEQAVKVSDKNPSLTPYFLMKEANVYNAQKNYTKEAEIYQTILDEYPAFGPRMNIDFEKYLERAKNNAGNK